MFTASARGVENRAAGGAREEALLAIIQEQVPLVRQFTAIVRAAGG